jgi:pyrimidine operon attenuation protein/uracil phosphoribosyltransferase
LLENCFEEKEVFIGGIHGNGFELAKRLTAILKNNSDIEVHLFEIGINKDEPWSEDVKLSLDKDLMKNGYIVLVDDVLNSGKTMQFALVEILQFPTKAIKTLTLVDRTHRRFPIKANFVGLALSTTLKERVEIEFSESKSKAYLV